MSTDYIPRPARLQLRMEGVKVLDLRLENDQARVLVRELRETRRMWILGGQMLSDQDAIEMWIATLIQERQL
jgi:hypothetical protein